MFFRRHRVDAVRRRRRSLQNWQAKLDAAFFYLALAEFQKSPKQAELLRQFAKSEKRHATRWADLLEQVPVYKPSKRTRLNIWIAKHVDPALVLPRAARLERLEADRCLAQGSEIDLPP